MSTADSPPGAGAVAAEAVILAANLCEVLARGAAGWDDARGVTIQAAHLKSRAAAARDANVSAYAAARRELQVPRGSSTGRDGMLAATLLASADTLLAIVTAAADTTHLAADVAAHLAPDHRPDAVGAAEIAAGAAAAAAELVCVNLALASDDPRRTRATELLVGARANTDRARRSLLS